MTEQQAYEMEQGLTEAGYECWIMNDSRTGYSVVITGHDEENMVSVSLPEKSEA